MARHTTALLLNCLAVGVQFAAAPAAAQTQTASVEVPIREVDLSDGTRRYVVSIAVDGHPIDAGLDTGSVGLRVLPSGVESAAMKEVGPVQRYGYAVGTTLEGPVVRTEVSVGGLREASRWQAIRTIGCSVARPDCPAAHVDRRTFGIQGNGIAGEGFRAILGVGLADADLPNPFREIGAHRWIIELPRPGEASSGRLILNPSDDQVVGFTPLPLADANRSRANDAVRACLQRDGGKPICAPTLIDSGAPGVELVNHGADRDWAEGTTGRLTFGDAASPQAMGVRFIVGRRAQASRFSSVTDPRVEGVRVRSGLLTYFAYDVLYDADHGTLAIKARPAYRDGVIAVGGGYPN
ncbi:hypothetical protein [Sphingomonas sp. TREG-RG-20F-R18-01]|uniref:hypothetical protein n=1 Tax=Sphingomonas sp. TREG-RG-20F-R18-01 TaxID=2914982 RepID=UPI001F5A1DF7|nr:hypothetical protein [Sphingomonas sp. TREG-RG-20F-R18-01]